MVDKQDVAIALDFDLAEKDTPTVIASGRGAVARQILAVAFEHGINVREDRDLATILSQLEIGEEIPVIAFAAVAEILSHVYRWEMMHAQTRNSDETNPL